MGHSSQSEASTSAEPRPELFSYLPQHRVIICTICSYAVPPKAAARHLKEIHRILRSARRPFIKWITTLDLVEPEDVLLPSQDDFPVQGLPVYSGLRCDWPGCGHLCLAEKRMKSHIQLVHGTADCGWASTQIQTFFRGRLLRYFSADDSICPEVQGDGYLVWKFLDIKWRGQQGAPPPPWAFKSGRMFGSPAVYVGSLEGDSVLAGLVHHYQKSTSQTIATGANDKQFWANTVLQMGHAHSFLMLAILSISSLHLAFLLPAERKELTMRANEYHGQAMPLFRAAIASPNSENCHAILIFSHFLILNTFTSEQQDDNLLLVTSGEADVVPLWLYFMRNGCSVLCRVWDDVEAGPCRGLALAWDAPFQINNVREKAVSDTLLAVAPLRDSLEAWSDDVYEIYQEAASELALAFACTDSKPHSFTTWDALRVWPMRISDRFVGLLKEHHPAALILLAHYTTLLGRIDSMWYFQGRAMKLLQTVKQALEPHWHPLLPEIQGG